MFSTELDMQSHWILRDNDHNSKRKHMWHTSEELRVAYLRTDYYGSSYVIREDQYSGYSHGLTPSQKQTLLEDGCIYTKYTGTKGSHTKKTCFEKKHTFGWAWTKEHQIHADHNLYTKSVYKTHTDGHRTSYTHLYDVPVRVLSDGPQPGGGNVNSKHSKLSCNGGTCHKYTFVKSFKYHPPTDTSTATRRQSPKRR